MKQTIRIETFETNSSSYHTISIGKREEDKIRHKTFDYFKDTKIIMINPSEINKLTNKWSESYVAIGETDYEKAVMLLRMLASTIDDELMDLVPYDNNMFSEQREESRLSKFYTTKPVKAFIRAIKKTLGNDWQVQIIFDQKYSPFISGANDDDYSCYETLGITEEEFEDEEKLANRLNEIIFDPNITIKDVYESNE